MATCQIFIQTLNRNHIYVINFYNALMIPNKTYYLYIHINIKKLYCGLFKSYCTGAKPLPVIHQLNTAHLYNILTLYVLYFSEDAHVFAYYFIPPHWHAINIGNPSSCKTRNCLFYIVNVNVADVLVTRVARASTAMMFTMLNRINSVMD